MIHVFYDEELNIDLGILNYLHPFDGLKFRKIYQQIKNKKNVLIVTPHIEINQTQIDEFVNELIHLFLRHKEHIFRAIEVPKIPFVGLNYLDKKILRPMRLGVGNTLAATKLALTGQYCWNLAGGYHHASQHSIEGFCIYNDIGITYQELCKTGELTTEDKILIIDTDAHHGNGNARTFIDNPNVTILDVYNGQLYPRTPSTRERVNLPVPLASGVTGNEYLSRFKEALVQLDGDYKVAFVVAGTDVLATDKLGGMLLTQDDVVQREKLTLTTLKSLAIPAVFLGGGGYSKDSANAIAAAINKLSEV